jgi:hypothetical protein
MSFLGKRKKKVGFIFGASFFLFPPPSRIVFSGDLLVDLTQLICYKAGLHSRRKSGNTASALALPPGRSHFKKIHTSSSPTLRLILWHGHGRWKGQFEGIKQTEGLWRRFNLSKVRIPKDALGPVAGRGSNRLVPYRAGHRGREAIKVP